MMPRPDAASGRPAQTCKRELLRADFAAHTPAQTSPVFHRILFRVDSLALPYASVQSDQVVLDTQATHFLPQLDFKLTFLRIVDHHLF